MMWCRLLSAVYAPTKQHERSSTNENENHNEGEGVSDDIEDEEEASCLTLYGYNPDIITKKDVSWIQEIRCIRLNPDIFSVKKCFIPFFKWT